MFDRIRSKSLLFLPAAFLFLSLFALETAHAKKQSSRKSFTLGGFSLIVEESSESWSIGKAYNVALSQANERILEEQSYLLAPEVKYIKGIPAKDCNAMLAMLYSGGAHCCFTAILCTVCGTKETAAVLDLSDSKELSFLDVNGDGAKEIAYHDMQFSYYDPDIANLDLSFSSSPAMLRLLVFEQNRWRPDKPGEHKKFYSDLLLKSRSKADRPSSARKGGKPATTEDEPLASSAMEAAYYSLMAGDSAEKSKALLRKLLPPSWREAEEKIFADIEQNLQEANPVIQQFVK